MSDKHTLNLDYQIEQARKVKRLEAENARLRALLIKHGISADKKKTKT